jgi:hypothetical protein
MLQIECYFSSCRNISLASELVYTDGNGYECVI